MEVGSKASACKRYNLAFTWLTLCVSEQFGRAMGVVKLLVT
jgi:hypothetical protein